MKSKKRMGRPREEDRFVRDMECISADKLRIVSNLRAVFEYEVAEYAI
jgi:hypothetical protein